MITWGVSAASHNAALAVFNDNELVFASESERFSRVKNDLHLNQELVDHARYRYGRPDKIVWYEKPWLKTLRQLTAGQGWQHVSPSAYMESFGVKSRFKTVSHHLSHAAGGYYTSNFREACIVVIDAIGEFETTSIWKASDTNLKKVKTLHYPTSMGLWYSAMTQRIGLKPNEEEYILMGMAAYGDPNRLKGDIYRAFFDPTTMKTTMNLHLGCEDWRPDLTSEQDKFDIAAGTQAVYEMLLESIIREARLLTGSKNLVLSGGCALNCMANPILFEYFNNVWIMPAPGDSGSCIGSVLADSNDFIHWPGPFLGYDMGYKASNEEIVDYLLEHKWCGVARGKAEFGPRALGNRSLLADPRGPEIKALINTIKKRQQFRPFAPSVLAEFADQVFLMPTKSAPYMQYIAHCKEYESYPAIVHYDHTSRVQTVSKADNEQYYELLRVWYARTGCPMLLNTSLNIKGEPIVNNHGDAKAWSEKYGLQIFN